MLIKVVIYFNQETRSFGPVEDPASRESEFTGSAWKDVISSPF
jgi:hypothetical protein